MSTRVRAKEKGHCSQCMFTVFRNELVNYGVNGAYVHLNCAAAVTDGKGRTIHPDFKHYLYHMNPETVSKILGE